MISIRNLLHIENEKDFKFINKHFLLSKMIIIMLFLILLTIDKNYFKNALMNFDAEHYYNIGVEGYTLYSQLAFFPLFPMIIKFFNLFKIPILGTLTFNLIIHYLSTILIYKFSKDIYKNSDRTTYNILVLWFFSPIAFFNSILYSEGLFIFLSLSSFYLYKKNKNFILCGILLGLSVCTRNFGAILFFSIFIILFVTCIKEEYIKNKKQIIINIIKIYIPATLLSILYPTYLFIHTGSWKTFIDVQYSIWRRVSSTFLTMTITDITLISNTTGFIKSVHILNFTILWVALIFICILLVKELVKKRLLKLDLILFFIGAFLGATSTMRNDGIAPASCSLYRYIYSLFPIFLLIDDDTSIIWFIYISALSELIVSFAYFYNIFLC